jgi:hypothetical protein
MSRSYLMGASDKDPEMGAFLELGNAWGNQPMIWDSMVKKYGHLFGADGMPFRDWDRLFGWIDSDKAVLKPWEVNVLVMTFDGVYLEGDDDMLVYAESLKKFHDAHSTPNTICHLNTIADRVQGLVKDKKVRWLGWYGTSVNANPWQVLDGEDDTRTFDMTKDLDLVLYDMKVKARRVKMVPLTKESAVLADTEHVA